VFVLYYLACSSGTSIQQSIGNTGHSTLAVSRGSFWSEWA